MNFYQIMTLIAVVSFGVLAVYAARALMQIRKTAEAAEYLLLTTAEKVDKTSSTFQLLNNISSILDNGLYKAIAAGIGVAHHLRKHKEKED